MKVWTENDMEPIIKKIDDEIRHPYRAGARTRELMIHLYHEITGSGSESDDLTIYGFKIGDLVPLAWALRKNGISSEEIEEWHTELKELYEYMLQMIREIREAEVRAAAEALKERR